DVAVLVEPDQRRGGDLVEEHAEGVQEEVLGSGNARGEVRVVEIRPAVDDGQPIRGGEVDAGLPLLGRHHGRNTANTLSEFEIQDSRKARSSGLRPSSAIAPARQNQFKSSWWPRSSACSIVVSRHVAQSPSRSAS